MILMNACTLTASVTAIANTLACKYTPDELTLLGAVFTQLGDTLATIAAQKSLCESGRDSNSRRSKTRFDSGEDNR